MFKILRYIIIFSIVFIAFWMINTTFTVSKYYDSADIAKEAFNLINNERVSQGIPPLSWDENMARQAEQYSVYMATIDKLVHSNMGYGENIAMGAVGSGKELYEAWKNSPPHHANYMSSQYTKGAIGIGFKLSNITIGDWTITYNISRGYATFIAD